MVIHHSEIIAIGSRCRRNVFFIHRV